MGAAELAAFFACIAPLRDKIGVMFLQLPPRFGPHELPRLQAFLATLPGDHHYAVELRHELFFAGGAEEDAVVELLRERGVDLVVMDTRGVHASKSLAFADVRGRKPNLPVVMRATAARPLVRFVPHEVFDESRALLAPWASKLAAWIA